jgi:antitoxin VapB
MVQKMGSGPSLNSKDPEARRRLAGEIAEITGETMTRAVIVALRERSERLRRGDPEAIYAEILAFSEEASKHIKQPYIDHAELLYDENGLPK